MLFPTVTFAIFFAVVLPLNWLLMPTGRAWRAFILVASYFFYGFWDWRFVLLLAGSTLWNQLWARVIARLTGERARRSALVVAVAGNLGVLGWFKYYDFFVVSATNLLRHVGIEVSPSILHVTLPVGISFFTFQALSYVIDVYRRQFEPSRLADFAVYLSFFPHIVAGPIVRASEFIPQLARRHDPRHVDASRAFFLILVGLFKKVVLANFLATKLVDEVFGLPELHSSQEILFSIYGYAVQIYCDFSGYTDIAIGIGQLYGIRLPENFNRPYLRRNLTLFWQSWHITLSQWVRFYVFSPLSRALLTRRRKPSPLVLALVGQVVTMVVIGLWHGVSGHFVLWGLWHGLGLFAHKWWSDRTRPLYLALRDQPRRARALEIAGVALTFHFVALGWVWFALPDLGVAWDVFKKLLAIGG